MASLQNILGGGFDANAVEPQQGFSGEPLPAGPYEVEITNAEVRDLKSGNGVGLNVEYTVIGPESYAGRKLWQNLNIKHTNPQAEQIGQSQLSSLCRALGIGVLNDSDELFQRILRVSVKIRPAKGDYPASNDITAYEGMGVQQGQAQRPAQGRAPASNAAAPKAAAPWARKAA